MKTFKAVLSKVLNPLRSRKVRTAIATAVAAYLVPHIPNIQPERIEYYIGVVVVLGGMIIGGTALEDAGAKVAMPPTNGDAPAPEAKKEK